MSSDRTAHALAVNGRQARAQRRRWSRRGFLGAAFAVASGLWLYPERRAHADASGGLIVLPRGREIILVTPTGVERTIVSLSPGEFVADVALSPDRSRVAFGLFSAQGGSGSDIVIAPVENGADRTIVALHDRPGTLLAAPQWSPDGQALVFESVGSLENGQENVTAEWVAADGTGRRTIARSARYPSFSPDGTSIVYTQAVATGDALWEKPLGGGEGREILASSAFLLIVYPRFSPDGNLIAFGGVDGPPFGLPGRPGNSDVPGPPGRVSTPSRPGAPGAPPAPKLLVNDADPGHGLTRSVAAHGFPAEPFVVPLTGINPRRLASLPIDDAAIAWSPDGGRVAVSGANGLFLVGLIDGSVARLTQEGSFGAIDWR